MDLAAARRQSQPRPGHAVAQSAIGGFRQGDPAGWMRPHNRSRRCARAAAQARGPARPDLQGRGDSAIAPTKRQVSPGSGFRSASYQDSRTRPGQGGRADASITSRSKSVRPVEFKRRCRHATDEFDLFAIARAGPTLCKPQRRQEVRPGKACKHRGRQPGNAGLRSRSRIRVRARRLPAKARAMRARPRLPRRTRAQSGTS